MKIQSQYPIILQPVDSPRRDLEWKLLLASETSKLGFDTIIGVKHYINACHAGSENTLWLGRFNSWNSRNTKDRTLINSFSEKKTDVFFLHDEGAFYESGNYRESMRMVHPTEYLSNENFKKFLFWGEKQMDIIDRDTDTLYKDRLVSTGYPRFDFYLSKYFKVDEKEVSRLKKTYGKFIFIPTRFATANKGPDDPPTFSDYAFEMKKNILLDDKITINKIFSNWQVDTINFAKFVCLIKDIAHAHPDKHIVLRPHPAEDFSFYKNTFSFFPNVTVSMDGDVRPWLKAAALVVQCECTTGVEASLAGTPVVNYIPTLKESPEFNVEGMETVGRVTHKHDQALEFVKEALNGSKNNLYTDLLGVSNILENVNRPSVPIIIEELTKYRNEIGNKPSYVKLPRTTYKSFRVYQKVKLSILGKYHKNDVPSKKMAFNEKVISVLWNNLKEVTNSPGRLYDVGPEYVIIKAR